MSENMLNKNLLETIERARRLAVSRRDEALTAEHLVLAMFEDPEAGKHLGALRDPKALAKRLNEWLDENIGRATPYIAANPGRMLVGMDVREALDVAAANAQASGRKSVGTVHALIEILRLERKRAGHRLVDAGGLRPQAGGRQRRRTRR